MLDIQLIIKRLYQGLKKVLSFWAKSTIVFGKRYYRFPRKVLSFPAKGTIVFQER